MHPIALTFSLSLIFEEALQNSNLLEQQDMVKAGACFPSLPSCGLTIVFAVCPYVPCIRLGGLQVGSKQGPLQKTEFPAGSYPVQGLLRGPHVSSNAYKEVLSYCSRQL